MNKALPLLILLMLFFSCKQNKNAGNIASYKTTNIFEAIPSTQSGIDFSNNITPNVATKENLLDYDYFYNGAGVGIADINNDDLPDIFFCGNQMANKLYLNKGNLRFEDISNKAQINRGKQWSNGVTFADVNGDGWLDIYVAQGGPKEAEQRHNLLFINQKDLSFKESSREYGLADNSISTQSAFFDYDKDGDLDVLVMNESLLYGFDPIRFYNGLAENKDLLYQSSSHLYQNNDGKFVDVTEKAALLTPTFGLGLVISDINGDGWLDIYIANDYYQPDALYINQRNGTFLDEIKGKTKQLSFYGMGVDIADINNDGHQDIYVLDMASQDHYRAKTLMASMSTANFRLLTEGLRFPHQYMFNSLQLNNGLNEFKNIAHLAGVAKTDWSWAGLMVDLDNSSQKEIFVTNGYRKYALDNDFKNQVVATKTAHRGKVPLEIKRQLYEQMPSEKLPNILYQLKEDLKFKNVAQQWGLGQATYSNGAAYADLDKDGDLELVVNNIDDKALVYKNLSIEKSLGNYLRVKVKGTTSESFAKVNIYWTSPNERPKKQLQSEEIKRVRGYLSAIEPVAHFGLGQAKKVDVVQIKWSDGSLFEQKEVAVNQTLVIDKSQAQNIEANKNTAQQQLFEQVSIGTLKLSYRHKEDNFDDFEKEILLPYKQSTLGPLLTKGDLNGDGKEDLFISGATGEAGQIFVQEKAKFKRISNPVLEADAIYEDLGAVFLDVDSDGDQDLFVVSGGNSFERGTKYYHDRLYLNDGQGHFSKTGNEPFKPYNFSGKTACKIDYDGDGDMDLIVGNRIVPQTYPMPAPSFVFENDKGDFREVTLTVAPQLADFGIINQIIASDFDSDGQMDFIAVGEWTSIGLFRNNGGQFTNIASQSGLDKEKGWWFSIGATDVNQDGLKDYLIGNVGQNIKFKASPKQAFKVYGNDFDSNGTFDIVLSKTYKGQYVPVRGRECSSQQMPFITEKFPTYDQFAKASLSDIYGTKLDSSVVHEATTFQSILLLNRGKGRFDKKILPIAAQMFPVLAFAFEDLNGDGYEDAILAGNIYDMEVETPRLDAGTGLVLISDQKDAYIPLAPVQSGLYFSGDLKDMEWIEVEGEKYLVGGRNNELLAIFKLNKNGKWRIEN